VGILVDWLRDLKRISRMVLVDDPPLDPEVEYFRIIGAGPIADQSPNSGMNIFEATTSFYRKYSIFILKEVELGD
jgi:hypothetical protein